MQPIPHEGNQDSLHPVSSQVLAVLNLLTAVGAMISLWLRYQADLAGQPLALAALLFAGGLAGLDLVWLRLTLTGYKPLAPESFTQRSLIHQALLRPHSLFAWLIFHTAITPLLLLGPRSSTLELPAFLAFLAAVLVMGLLPVGLIVWLHLYLARKLHS